MKIFKTIILALFCLMHAWADSPLTSTDIWKGYRDLPEVTMARDIERLNTKLAYYLVSSASIDKKIAMINALSWNYHGKQNAMLFREVLAQKYKTPQVDAKINAEERLCLAYLIALDDYFDVREAHKMALQAQKQLPKSFTVAIVCKLIEAQKRFKEQDKLWTIVEPVLNSKDLKNDMRPAARKQIVDYMILYKD